MADMSSAATVGEQACVDTHNGTTGNECILSFMPEIVEHVFRSLPVKELNKCCR